MGVHGPAYIEVARCELCRDLVPVATNPLSVHGHCDACCEPRELACADCGVLTREDVLDAGRCESCVADAYERDEQAAEE